MPRQTNGTKRRFVVSIVAVLVGLIVAGVLYLSLVPIDVSSHHERIEALILEHSTHKVTMERAVLRLLPSPRLTFKGFRVIDDTETLLYADSWDVTLTWNSFYSSVLTIDKLEVDSPELVVRRDREGVVNVVEYVKTHRPKRVIRLKSLRINAARAHVEDHGVTEPQEFDLKGFTAAIDETFTGFSYKVSSRLLPSTKIAVKGNFYPGRRKFDMNGHAHEIDLAQLGPYLRDAGIKTAASGSVNINGSIEYGDDLMARGRVDYSGLLITDERYLTAPLSSPSGTASLSYSTEPTSAGLRINDIDIDTIDFTVKGSASVLGSAEERSVELALSTSTIPVEAIKRATTIKALPPKYSKALKGLGVPDAEAEKPAGGVAIEKLVVKGRPSELTGSNILSTPDALSASIRFNNLSFTHTARKGSFTGFNGGGSLNGSTLTLMHISGLHGTSQLRDISGTITDITGSPAYDIYLDGQFDASELIDTLGPAVTGADDKDAGGGVNASGRVDLTVRSRGTVEGGWPEDISATARFQNASVTHPRLPIDIKGLSGHAAFNNVDISLTRLTATDGHSTMTFDGRIRNYPSVLKRVRGEKAAAKDPGQGIVVALKASGALEYSTIDRLVGDQRLEGLYFDGPLIVEAGLAGPPSQLEIKAAVDTTATQVSYRNWIKKGKNFPFVLNTELSLGGGAVRIRNSDVNFGESTLRFSGNISRDLETYDFALDADGLRITDIDNLSPLLRGDYDSRGTLKMSIKGVRKAGARPTYEGGITLKDGRFDSPLIAHPVERIDAEALLTDNSALVIVSSNIGESTVNARVEFSDISKRVIHFELTSPRLNTADILPEGVGKAITGGGKGATGDGKRQKPRGRSLSGGGVVYITTGTWWGHQVENFYTEVNFGERTVDIHPISINVDSGDITAELIYNRDAENPVLYRLTAEIAGMDTVELINNAGAKKKVLDGGLDGTISVWGQRGMSLTTGLNGNVNLLVGQGVLWKFILFSKIFSIVNIFSIDEFLQEGLRFKTLRGDFTITDGVISTEDMVLDSDSMKMSAVGKIYLKDGTMDSVLAMHPFVTIDKIITSIPLAGWVIAGPEGSTVSMYYTIDGPLKNLNVNPVPKTNVGGKVLGIFERLLELPVQVLAPEELKKAKEKAKEKETQ